MLLSGNRTMAHATAEGALQLQDLRLLSPGFAGPFARWLGQMGRVGRMGTEANTCIERLLSEAQEFDVLDRAEILCSSLIIAPRSRHAAERRAELNELLMQLPPATVDQLRRLEALPQS